MKKILLALAIVLGVHVSFAQPCILMGKIIDEHNAPIKHALLKASLDNMVHKATFLSGGLYYVDSLMPGEYVIAITVNKVNYTAKVMLTPPTKERRVFHNFKLNKANVLVMVVENDPFMENALRKVKKDPALWNY